MDQHQQQEDPRLIFININPGGIIPDILSPVFRAMQKKIDLLFITPLIGTPNKIPIQADDATGQIGHENPDGTVNPIVGVKTSYKSSGPLLFNRTIVKLGLRSSTPNGLTYFVDIIDLCRHGDFEQIISFWSLVGKTVNDLIARKLSRCWRGNTSGINPLGCILEPDAAYNPAIWPMGHPNLSNKVVLYGDSRPGPNINDTTGEAALLNAQTRQEYIPGGTIDVNGGDFYLESNCLVDKEDNKHIIPGNEIGMANMRIVPVKSLEPAFRTGVPDWQLDFNMH